LFDAEIKQKKFIVFRTTTVSNFAVGFRPGQTDLVIVPLEEKSGTVTAGTTLRDALTTA